jgi:nucleoside-diphosphate-sugar epimerase
MHAELITGATGFIGRHLSERLLREGRKIKLFCRPRSEHKLSPLSSESAEIVIGDLRDHDSIDKAMQGVERVYHCAGHVLDWGPEETFHATNVQGTQWLLEAAVEQKVKRFIHLSSIAVFGVPSPHYFDDKTPYNPGKDFYSRSKIEGETLAFQYHRDHGLPVVVLRPSVVYGPGSGWIEEPLRLIRKNKMFLIAGGKGTCHPCYIDNLIDAILFASEHPNAIGQGYIVGDNKPISFEKFFNLLAKIVGSKPIKKSIPLPLARIMASLFESTHKRLKLGARPFLTHTAINMLTTQSTLCMDKIRRELNFEPEFSVEEGMDQLKRWIENANDSAQREKNGDD